MTVERVAVRRALLSVSDKTGLEDLARGLVEAGVELLSTGGTAAALREAGLPVRDVSDVTGFPEILDGRVKTLHPAVHAGILARRDREGDARTLDAHGIAPIDLVVVNLYAFQAAAADPGATRPDLLERVDIGGPTLLRAAAKNYPDVVVLCRPADYAGVLASIREGGVPEALRARLAATAFAHTAAYDAAIADAFRTRSALGGGEEGAWPEAWSLPLVRRQALRYGENPHQGAALYEWTGRPPVGITACSVHQGKELSYNNLLDVDAGWRLAMGLGPGAAVVIKHRNPCGAARDADPMRAFQRAWEGDPKSAFGGVVVLRGPVDAPLAAAIVEHFVEVVACEAVDEAARSVFATKKRLRLLTSPELAPGGAWPADGLLDVRTIAGGVLVQHADAPDEDVSTWTTATTRPPTDRELAPLAFAWQVARSVQSNAIVLAKGERVIGVGCGQTSRVDAVELAIRKAEGAGHDTRGSVLASDAFFPFGDSIETAAHAGVTAVVQPGGSLRDTESVEAANAAGMAMLFTSRRAFRH